ncbi:MAG: B12-binding domain-containing radical SAM protein [Thermoplasmatales archaeon]|nr:MAG: B12-binding domain-containing radical SAM protein [Thermoplasmatales archaeon]
MNILFIQPRLSEMQKSWWKRSIDRAINKFYAPPLTLEQLYAITPNDHDVKVIDERIGQKINYDGNYDLVGITAFTPYINRAYEIADAFRKMGVKVVLGGYHPTAIPDEAKQHADSVLLGEAEYTWLQLLKDVENNGLRPFYLPDRPIDQNDIPPAKRDQTRGNYFYAAVQASRGCPNRCEFCAISNLKFRNIVRKRPVENVIDEIKTISQKHFHFYDPSLTLHPTYSKSLFREMKGLNKKFTCNGNVGALNKDEELLKLASEAGCTRWYIGFESFSQQNMDLLKKQTNRVEEYAPAVKKIRDYGMDIYGLFMFGMDYDTPDVFDSTLKAVNDLGLIAANFSILTPYPGTPLHDRLDKEGRIFSKDWSKYRWDEVVIKPKGMSSEELLHGVRKIKREFYSLHNFSQMIRKEKVLELGLMDIFSTYFFSMIAYRFVK